MIAPQEIEGKWLVKDLRSVEFKLNVLGAVCSQTRVYENNLRYDTPERVLSHQEKVLRLRKDNDFRFTFKAPLNVEGSIRNNTEIEFTVGDFDLAKQFLDALGYEMYFQYEKYRAVYELDGCHIMLDELPYGDFVEIEGEEPSTIADLAEKLELDIGAGSERNYSRLFDDYLCISGNIFEHLTFKNFEQLAVSPDQLGLRYADQNED